MLKLMLAGVAAVCAYKLVKSGAELAKEMYEEMKEVNEELDKEESSEPECNCANCKK